MVKSLVQAALKQSQMGECLLDLELSVSSKQLWVCAASSRYVRSVPSSQCWDGDSPLPKTTEVPGKGVKTIN